MECPHCRATALVVLLIKKLDPKDEDYTEQLMTLVHEAMLGSYSAGGRALYDALPAVFAGQFKVVNQWEHTV